LFPKSGIFKQLSPNLRILLQLKMHNREMPLRTLLKGLKSCSL
jgi:hypothetical protein